MKYKFNIQLFADGKVVINTALDNSGFKEGLSKMTDIAKKGFKAVAKSVTVATGAITALVGASVKAAGELEQQIGGSEAVFKSLGETIDDIKFKSFQDGEGQLMSLAEVAKEAYATMGLSANDYMATLNKMGALMQGSGLDAQSSLDLAGQAMQRAADVASIMGIDINDAMNSIAGAAKGNFTMMDNLGVAMNATTIEAYALSKGIEVSYNEMDNAQKVGLAMEMFLEKTQYATGNYIKENQTFAGSFSTLKAAMSNFLSGAGGVKEVGDALVSFAGILTQSIGEMAPQITEGLVNLVNNLIPQIPILLQKLLPSVLQGAMSLIDGLVAVFPALLDLIRNNAPTIIQGAITIVKTLINTILDMLPEILQLGIDLVIELVNGIAEAAPDLIPKIVETMLKLFMIITDPENLSRLMDAGVKLLFALIEGIIKSLPKLLENGETTLQALLNVLSGGQFLMAKLGWELLKSLIKGLIDMIPGLKDKAIEIKDAVINAIKNGISTIFNVGSNLVQGLWNGISGSLQWIKNKISGWIGNVMDFIKKLFGIHSPSTVMRDEVGKYLAQGMGVGFDKELPSIYDDMQRAIDLETEKMSANVQTSGTYQMAMAGTPTFNLLDNTENTTQLVVNGKVLAEVVNTENRNREVASA